MAVAWISMMSLSLRLSALEPSEGLPLRPALPGSACCRPCDRMPPSLCRIIAADLTDYASASVVQDSVGQETTAARL